MRRTTRNRSISTHLSHLVLLAMTTMSLQLQEKLSKSTYRHR